MERDLSRRLHKLTLRLDRAADRLLGSEAGLSYARFLALYMVGQEGIATQRELAERLAVSEPSVSRMVRVLSDEGYLEAAHAPGSGNRRRLRLTPAGDALLQKWGAVLEERFAEVVEAAGVPYDTYRAQTERLLAALDPA